MTLRAALLLSLFGSCFAIACDSASIFEDCANPQKEATGEARCLPSRFQKEDPRARESAGYVSIGSERVPNALVTINGTPTTTDIGGIYRFRDTPFRYDVAARIEDEVVGFYSAAYRFIDIALERDGVPKAYSGTVKLTVKNAPRPGNRLVAFATGDDVVAFSGSVADGIVVSSRRYDDGEVKIHVVEYPENGGIEKAVAKGDVDVQVKSGTTTLAEIALYELTDRRKSKFTAASDDAMGFAFEDIEILMDMGVPFGRQFVRKIKFGEEIELPIIPRGTKDREGNDQFAGWVATTKATRPDGSLASIGLRPFGPGDTVELVFFAPPAADRNEGSMLFATRRQPKGVYEHVLVPTNGDGRNTIHVFSAKEEAKVPDLVPLGLAPARGEYRWTVRVFPDFDIVEAMGGTVNRLYRSSSTSAPRTIVLP